MSETFSSMMPLGSKAPSFQLLNTVTNKMLSLEDLKIKKALVVMFLCNHCPYVKHIKHRLIELARDYETRGTTFIAINSNDRKTYPEDGPEYMQEEAIANNYPFPYLYDETQEVAKAYQAECTPDFFVFDANLQCVYRGRFDDSTPGNRHISTGADLSQALDALIQQNPISQDQKASVGCNIKWKNPRF